MPPVPHSLRAFLRRRFSDFRFFFAALLSAALASVAVGAADAPPPTGAIEGRVLNAKNGMYLHRVLIVVEGSSLETYTNEFGEYQLRNVPAGEARLRLEYTGQNTVRDVVAVAAGQTVTRNFAFNGIGGTDEETGALKMDPYVVQENRFRNAQDAALNEERFSTNIKSVVATDSLGYITDGNIGEFVKFLPGVDVSFGGTNANPANATSVGVRGFGADSTAILVDGMPIASASPGGLTRTIQLDGVSINNATRIEVIKVATPDMRQDSPGGVINLVTRSSFEQAKPSYELSIALNGGTNQPNLFKKTPGPADGSNYRLLPNVRLSATFPVLKNLGFSVSAGSDNKASLQSTSSPNRLWANTTINLTPIGGAAATPQTNASGGIKISNPVINRITLNDTQNIDHRINGNLKVDWRPFPGLSIKANGQVASLKNMSIDRRNQFTIGMIQDWAADYVKGYQGRSSAPGVTAFNPAHRVEMTIFSRDRTGFTTSGYLEAKFQRGPWDIKASASASESFGALNDLKNGHFSGLDNTMSPGRMEFTGIDKGVASLISIWNNAGAPVEYAHMDPWSVGNSLTVSSGESYNRDLAKQFILDVSRHLDFLPFPMTLKTGAYRGIKSQHKWGKGAKYQWRYLGPNLTAKQVESDYATEAKFGYAAPQHWVDTYKLYEIFTANPQQFDENWIDAASNTNLPALNYNSVVGQRKGVTDIATEWYLMTNASFFKNRLKLTAGARQAHKSTEGYNLANDGSYVYVKLPNGQIYRDSDYPNGVRFDGGANGTKPRDAVLTDAALRARMTAAKVVYLPSRLELAPNGVANGTRENNLFFAPLGRYTRHVDASRLEKPKPQIQLAFDLTKNLSLQLAWSNEVRLPDLEGANSAVLSSGADFNVTPAAIPSSDPGGDGQIRLANVRSDPEKNQSYNLRLAYYTKGGSRYSVSYYYKTVKNEWIDTVILNDDPDYDTLLESMGLSRSDYANWTITTSTASGQNATRKGYEIEVHQNFDFLGKFASRFSTFATYTRRPVTASSVPSNPPLGWIPLLPVRAKWTGGIAYNASRFSVKMKGNWVESGITRNGSGTTVTLPDGTNRSVQFYNLNKNPFSVNVQVDVSVTRRISMFVLANRFLESRTWSQVADEQTGLMPEHATWGNMTDRGITVAAGTSIRF